MKIKLLHLFFISALILTLSCEDKDNPTDIKKYNKYISGCTKLIEGENNISINEIVYFESDVNGSTGYDWYYTISGELVLQYLDGETFCLENCDDDIVGSARRSIVKFQALGIGTTILNYKYYRSWLGEEDATSEKNYKIIVTNK